MGQIVRIVWIKDLVLAEEPFGKAEPSGPIYHLNPIGLKTICDLNALIPLKYTSSVSKTHLPRF
jgi:hypothetical protein